MIEIVPFHPHHARQVLPKVNLPKDYFSQAYLDFMHLNGMAFSARKWGEYLDYDYLGFGGLLPMWEGVAELYTFLTDEMKIQYPLLLHRTSKNFIRDMQKKFNLHRLQCCVQLGDHSGYKWAVKLGFVNEGTMPLFTPDKKTFIRFAKVWQ